MDSVLSLADLWQRNLAETTAPVPRPKWQRLQQRAVIQRAAAGLAGLLARRLRPFEPDGSTVITTDRIDQAAILALCRQHTACAIHVPGFCPPDVAERLSVQAVEECTQWKLGGQVLTDMFYAHGSVPREVASRSWTDFQRYFGEREEFVQRQRVLSDARWPVDRLQAEIGEAWPTGARLGEWLGEPVRPAIVRVMFPDAMRSPAHGLGYIHVDDVPVLRRNRAMLSANIYLKLPPRGGALCIWSVNLGAATGRAEKIRRALLAAIGDHAFEPAWQEHLRRLLPAPHVIRPRLGDLILIHSGRPHSVEPVADGLRVTTQTFVRAEGEGPLTIGS